MVYKSNRFPPPDRRRSFSAWGGVGVIRPIKHMVGGAAVKSGKCRKKDCLASSLPHGSEQEKKRIIKKVR